MAMIWLTVMALNRTRAGRIGFGDETMMATRTNKTERSAAKRRHLDMRIEIESEAEMNCSICEKACESGAIVPSIGYACDGCIEVAQRRRQDLHDELRAEPLGEMPSKFQTATFERYALKFSIQFLDALSPAGRDRVIRANPMLVIPETFSLWIKELILQHIPGHYMTTVQLRGHDRLFSSGQFRFFKPVPAKIILRALQKSKLIKTK